MFSIVILHLAFCRRVTRAPADLCLISITANSTTTILKCNHSIICPILLHTGDCTPVVIRQLRLGAGVLLLLLPLDYEAVSLLAVRGVLQVALLVTGIIPEELLDVFHNTGVFGGSPLPRSSSLVPFALASRASTSRTVVVQVLVAFFVQRQLEE